MRSKLALPVLVAASLFGATTIASAQMQPTPGASSEGTSTHMKSTKSSKMKSGATTGMSKGTSRNPSGEGNVGPGNNNGPTSGSK
jgi:uncharacterized low-complexity protein